MRLITFIILSLLLSITVFGQEDIFQPLPTEEEKIPETQPTELKTKPQITDVAKEFSKRITKEDIKKHLEILASDEMEGRETGRKGQQLAAEYIAGEYKKMGLETTPNGTYFQKIQYAHNQWLDLSIKVGNRKFRYMWDFYAFPSSNTSVDSIIADEVVFLGYGIDDEKYSDYEKVDVKDKVIMIYQEEPLDNDSVSYLTGKRAYSGWSVDWRKKLITAKQKGVKAVIFIEPNVKRRVSRYRDRLLSGQTTMEQEGEEVIEYANSIYVSKEIAKEIIGPVYYKKFIRTRNKIRKKGKPYSVSLPAKVALSMVKEESILKGENVLGFIEGRDSVLKEEIVVVSAHYDHLGKRGDDIYNGADDNGSGSSTVLDIAEAFAQAQKEGVGPRRSILFMLVSGEEKGLLGSAFYVNYPVYPLEKTIVDVNVDMIGRVDEKHADNPNYIYVIGADRLSTELHDINEAMNEKYTNIELDYTYNEEDDPNRYYYRSDHYNFAERGIPAIFYFSGVHEDYHRVTDTVDKIKFGKTAKIGQLIFHTIWQLANQDKTIEVDVKVKKK